MDTAGKGTSDVMGGEGKGQSRTSIVPSLNPDFMDKEERNNNSYSDVFVLFILAVLRSQY